MNDTKMKLEMKGCRDSNLEWLRIVAMLAIIAHHYVVNSGIMEFYDFQNINVNMVFLQFWGMGGKAAINAFVLITGYFMCTMQQTWIRILKLWLEVEFYNISILGIMAVMGYQKITFMAVYRMIFWNLVGTNSGFTPAFFALCFFVPFLNALLKNIEKKELMMLIILLLSIFTVSGTFFFNWYAYFHIGWYMTIYFIGAYIRLYPNFWTEHKWVGGSLLGVGISLAWISILVVDYVGSRFGFEEFYYMVSDSHKILALMIGGGAFLLFKNWKIPHNRFINNVAATVFGVLMIHANSDAMRTFLWKDLLRVPEVYGYNFARLIVHAICSMIGVFAVCSIIDYVRLRFLEKPIMGFITTKKECSRKNIKVFHLP